MDPWMEDVLGSARQWAIRHLKTACPEKTFWLSFPDMTFSSQYMASLSTKSSSQKPGTCMPSLPFLLSNLLINAVGFPSKIYLSISPSLPLLPSPGVGQLFL